MRCYIPHYYYLSIIIINLLLLLLLRASLIDEGFLLSLR